MNNRSLFSYSLALVLTLLTGVEAQTTVFHYSVNGSDEATVAGGTVPGAGTSPDGVVAFGSLTLSDDVPTDGVPAGSGNRSMVFTNTQAVNAPGTQQLSHAAVIAEGGFTYEIWFKWDGGGNLNALIDYAGTEKFRMQVTGTLDFNFDSGSGAQVLATGVTPNEWHYAAVVFTHVGEPVNADLKINGTMTWYFNSAEAIDTIPATKDDFGDSLNRTIAVGGHPLGFSADFANGLIYEPRVTLGALEPEELLFGSGGGDDFRITSVSYDNNAKAPSVTFAWNSRPKADYIVEYSTDLENWEELDDGFASQGETTSFTHEFVPDFPNLIGTERLYYRVTEN